MYYFAVANTLDRLKGRLSPKKICAPVHYCFTSRKLFAVRTDPGLLYIAGAEQF